MVATTQTQLTTSRINRIFRPLRAKCASLAIFSSPNTRPAVSATYSSMSRTFSRRTHAEDEPPPLVILQPPESLGSRIHMDRASVESFQLSKKIYEVRDAFKNVIQSALGHTSMSDAPKSEVTRILSLAAMCAKIVGEHIQSEIEAHQGHNSAAAADDDIAGTVTDDLYDSVPIHYRSHAVISHALSLVLETCPLHPTLLTALLDVCLFFNLRRECTALLQALFTAALQPTSCSSPACPLTHPAHSNYLIALLPNTSRVLDTFAFTRILVDVFIQPTAGRAEAWISKAITRFAREMRSRDFMSFLDLCSGLAQTIGHIETLRSKKRARRKSLDDEEIYEHRLRDRLAKWVKSILERLHSRNTQLDSLEPWPTEATEEYQNVVEFLFISVDHNLYLPCDAMPDRDICLADALICLTTYCFASPLLSTLTTTGTERIRHILRDACTRTDSYDILVSLIFSPPSISPISENAGSTETPTPPPTSPLPQQGCMQALRKFTEPLRARRLYLREAAFWSNALRHVESHSSAPRFLSTMSEGQLSLSDLDKLRAELVEQVEHAEALHFGVQPRHDRGRADPAPQPLATPQRLAEASEWRWEEMVGCWVSKTPKTAVSQGPPKRRKVRYDIENIAPDDRPAPVQARPKCRPPHSESVPRASAHSLQAEAGPSTATRRRISAPVAPSKLTSRSASRVSLARDLLSEDESLPPSKPTSRSASRIAARRDPFPEDELSPPSKPTSRSASRTPLLRDLPSENEPLYDDATDPLIELLDPTPKPARRVVKLGITVAEAHRNCIVLHPRKENGSMGPTATQSRPDTVKPPVRPLSKRGFAFTSGYNVTVPSSDDALDLFAYADSSPVKPRHTR